MKSRQVLLKHLEQRVGDLKEYERICSSFGKSNFQYPVDFVRRREALLNLELPYEITYGLPVQNGHNTSYLENTSYSEKTTWNRIRERNLGITPENLVEIFWLKKAAKDIESLSHAQSSKKVLKSNLKGIAKGVEGPTRPSIYIAPKRIIDTEIIASYFAYLEKRCLDAWEIQPYRDLLEVRLLFYSSLPVSLLGRICVKDIDSEKRLISWENRSYPLPKTFIELAESILSSEDLIVRGIKQLNKFISQTSNAKRAAIPCTITAKTIQKSLEWIYRENGIAKDAKFRR